MADHNGWTLVEPAAAAGWTRVAEEKPASNAGMSLADLQAANLKNRADLPSTSGFLSNVATSGGNFLKDAATGAVGLVKGGFAASEAMNDPRKAMEIRNAFIETAKHAPQIASAAGTALKNRYGGVDEALHTAYTDPVGVASDVSTVAGGLGGAAKLGGATRIAKTLGAVSEATNPMSVIGKAAAAAGHGAGNLAVQATLRPPAAVRADFGGGKAMADAVLKDRVYSATSAQQKLTGSVEQADKMLAEAEAAGVPGVRRRDVARAVMGEPQDTAKLRTRLGVSDATPQLEEAAQGVMKNNPVRIKLTDAQKMKREAQSLAYEAGVDNNSVKKAAEKAKAGALRQGIEAQVPDVGPVNEKSQRLIGSQKAFAAAEDRPHNLSSMLSVLGAGAGFAGGGPFGAAAIPAVIQALNSPRAGAMTGIAMDSFGKGMNAKSLREAALLARLLEQSPSKP